MRLPKHHLLTDRQGRRHAVADWGLRPGKCRQLAECQVDGVWGGAQVTALAGGEYLFLFGTANVAFLGQFYRKHWTIEACFQNLKGRGFALRERHLQCRNKLKSRWPREPGLRTVYVRGHPASRKSTPHQNQKQRL